MGARPNGEILSFLHMERAGGTTLEILLRRNFGLRHLDAMTRHGWRYTAEDMRKDLRLNPFIVSMSGHWLRPCIDYEENAGRLAWYTFLREPVARYISQYQHVVEHRNPNLTLDAYLEDRSQWNWQVNKIAGAPDVAAARQILDDRFRCVGLLEQYNVSLLLMRQRLQLGSFNLAYGQPRNPLKRRDVRQRVMDQLDSYRERFEECNHLDIALHRHVTEVIFPRQIAEYGANRLEQDLQNAQWEARSSMGERTREIMNNAVRKTLYRAIVKRRARQARRGGIPYVRQ